MKKKMLGIIAFAAIAAVAGWNYNQNLNKIDDVELSDLVLENVEALANGESGNGMTDCPNGCLTEEGVCFCYGFHPYREA